MNATNANCRHDDSLPAVTKLQGPVRVPNGFPEVPSVLRGHHDKFEFQARTSAREVSEGRVPGWRLDHRPGGIAATRAGRRVLFTIPDILTFELGTDFIPH